MSDTLLRQWEMLRAIPRAPRQIEVGKLRIHLEAAGYRITLRTLQRDLNALSRVFPLQSNTRSTPYGWSWAAAAPTFDLPAMDGPTALSVRMIEQFIPNLLPPSIHQLLAPQFARARAVLEANPENPLGRWVDCMRIVPREMPLMAPNVDSEVVRAVYQGLLNGKRLKVRYSPRAETERNYEVNPLGLVVRGNLSYIVCTLWHYHDVKQLVLHRIRSAAILDSAINRPSGFNLDQYIAEGEFQYPVGPLIRLKAEFDVAAAAHLYETPLSADQTIEYFDADNVLVTASVRDTSQLEWWLLAFGASVKVLEPPSLSERLSNVTRAMAVRYKVPAHSHF